MTVLSYLDYKKYIFPMWLMQFIYTLSFYTDLNTK